MESLQLAVERVDFAISETYVVFDGNINHAPNLTSKHLIAAAVYDEVLHLRITFRTDYPLREGAGDVWQDQIVAVMWGVVFTEMLIECGNETNVVGILLPRRKFNKGVQNGFTLGLGHLRPSINASPAVIASIEAENRHDLLQYRVGFYSSYSDCASSWSATCFRDGPRRTKSEGYPSKCG
ncbi:hypothetical protein Q3G72_008089 [Acer saccharum]|nr:hypothetical protein Q3G72_008089 [Acer saccharum]